MTTDQTPMLKQYWQIKSEIEDKETILFFRLGDFYEMFFDDAKIASGILDITLTSRNKNDPNPVPLCGVPYHAVDGYIAKLLANGKKVAICDQVEDPKTAKGVVKREVVKIVTPGVLMETEGLVSAQNNYLAAIEKRAGGAWSLAVCDASTGDFRSAVLKNIHLLLQEISRIEPRETLLPRSIAEDQAFLSLKPALEGATITVVDDTRFDPSFAGELAVDGVQNETLGAVGAIREYLETTQKTKMGHIRRVVPLAVCEHMVVDESTKRNLELVRTMADGSHRGTLIWLLDQTKTAMGGRTLRRFLLYPLLNADQINERLSAVETLKNDFNLSEALKTDLPLVADVERITSRVVTGSANPRELVALKESLKILPRIKERLGTSKNVVPTKVGIHETSKALDSGFRRNDECEVFTGGLLSVICQKLDPCAELAEKIEAEVVPEPPLSTKDGGVIKNGVSAELDELRSLAADGKGFIARLEASERSRTGIGSLKVRYNRVFGYYIEITHTHAEKVPENYIRKQTLTNAERFITPELKEYEEKVLGAEERIRQLEQELFAGLREFASSFAGRLADTADAVGQLDAFASLAAVASQNRYSRPEIASDGEIKIVSGRHPIIEKLSASERFVPNDVSLDMNCCRMMMITGPNMAGKSTIMRQTALIVLMAQMGSFVPAAEAKVSVADRIFTRVGASDNLIKGQSTFMVEMSETAAILKEATEKSLVLIDEIGRGTSTYDGVSIAWAVAEFLHDETKAKTLFATHYHELTDLALTKPGIKNFNVAVKEWNDRIIFLRKLVEGCVNRSYGIQVARLAELPSAVIARAKEILAKLEKGEMALKSDNSKQMPLFEARDSGVEEAIKNCDTSVLTPIEALNLLHELKQKIAD